MWHGCEKTKCFSCLTTVSPNHDLYLTLTIWHFCHVQTNTVLCLHRKCFSHVFQLCVSRMSVWQNRYASILTAVYTRWVTACISFALHLEVYFLSFSGTTMILCCSYCLVIDLHSLCLNAHTHAHRHTLFWHFLPLAGWLIWSNFSWAVSQTVLVLRVRQQGEAPLLARW